MGRASNLDPDVAASYLQGRLSTEEADEFESEFLGASPMRRYLEEEGLLERYLRHELSNAELESVEKVLLADPALVDEIEKLSAVEQGLEDLKESGEYAPRAGGLPWTSRWQSAQFSAAASIAAAALLLSSGYLFVENRGLRNEIDAFVDSPVTRTIPLLTTRGAADVNELEPPAPGMLTTLMLDAAHVSDGAEVWFDEYRATVTRTDTDPQVVVFERDGLPLNFDDTVAVTISDRRLLPGRYEAALEGRMDDWAADRGFEPVRRVTFEITDQE